MGINFQASSGISLFAVVFTNPDHIWQNNTHESSQHPFCKSSPDGLHIANTLCCLVDSYG